jgi:hypothetical protein
MDAKFIAKTRLKPAFSNTLRCYDSVWHQSLQQVLIREFLKNFSQGKKKHRILRRFQNR